jgi:PAS domain S-box-containing protein
MAADVPEPLEFAALASVMPVGVLRTDLEGRCFYLSERVTDLTGLTAESALESGWEQCVHPDDREAVLRQVSSALHARKSWQGEFRCELPGGRIRWLLGQATPEHDLQGRVVGFVWTITDTTHTHEALRASEERFKLATKSAGVGVLDYDVMTDQGFWSPEVRLLLGVPEGRFTTLAEALDFCHPEDRVRVEVALAGALDPRGSGAFAEEFRIRRADTGEVRWVASACQTFFDGAADDRRPVRFTGIATDITERRARETHVQVLSERLLRNEERQAFLLRLSDALRPLSNPLDVQEVSSKLLGEHLGVNRVGYAELENREYVIRREYARGVAPLAGQGPLGSFAATLRDAFRRGETVVVNDVDTDPRFTDSERVAMRARQIAAFVGVMLLKGGQLVGAFGANNATPRSWAPMEIALIREVAERTWDAVERARAEAALREHEEALRARRDQERDREVQLLLETATQGIVVVDAQATIVTANRALEAMFGWAPGKLIGQSIERLVPPAVRDAHAQYWTGYFAEPSARPMGVNAELVGQRKDGSTFPLEVSLNHVADAGGGHAIAFVTDITERKRAAVALQERTIELEHRTAQLSRLASDLTLAEQHTREQLAKTLHDGLQQLLVGAALNLERHLTREEQRGAGPDDLLVRAKGHLDQASAAARSLSLELFPPALHLVGLPAALTWLAGRTRNQYGLVVQVTADPLANSDRKDVRTLLFESVRELLFNAVKHARVDRVTLDLSLDRDNALSITVADQGIGFDPGALAERGKVGKAGFGLFSIRERLTLLGGRFDIESAPGQGTRFRLVAPRGEAQGAIDAPLHLSRVATGPAIDGAAGFAPARPLRILIADDHAEVRRAFRELLQERPELHVVGEAADGLAAIATARELRPDIILMDISMPRMDGVEATRRIHAELPAIQILGLSTHVKIEDLHAIELVGAAGFFTKGVDTQRLIDHLVAVHAMTALESPGQPA